MSAPARLRDMYVVGRSGSFFVPTVAACDEALRTLRGVLRVALDRSAPEMTVRRIRDDQDKILDRRTSLAFEEAASLAMRIANDDLHEQL